MYFSFKGPPILDTCEGRMSSDPVVGVELGKHASTRVWIEEGINEAADDEGKVVWKRSHGV